MRKLLFLSVVVLSRLARPAANCFRNCCGGWCGGLFGSLGHRQPSYAAAPCANPRPANVLRPCGGQQTMAASCDE